MNQEELRAQFDAWAQTYDAELKGSAHQFPFAGYEQVLAAVFENARVSPGMTVVDLGVGTGNLARYFVDAGCQVVGTDFSAEMLARARAKLPQVELVQADLTQEEWPDPLNRSFDRIVSNYVFHEFPFEIKRHILRRLARHHLGRGGHIVIGDISFPNGEALAKTRQETGDAWEEEYYWTLDQTQAALQPAGWKIDYTQISFCTGVYTLHPPQFGG